jgi:hypothetical protein
VDGPGILSVALAALPASYVRERSSEYDVCRSTSPDGLLGAMGHRLAHG